MKRVVVSGATGMIGPPLVRALIDRGDRVTVWCRDEARARAALGDAITAVGATYETPGPWLEAARGADAIVHLAGEPIAGGRWDARRKQAIRDSRVESTRVIVEGLAAWPAAERPRALITASGADYYPFADRAMDDDDEILDFAWDVGVQRSVLESAERHIHKVPAQGRCMDCGHEFGIEQLYEPCPACGQFLVEVVRGKELRVKSLEVS